LVTLLDKLDHPWLLANAFDKNSGTSLGAATQTTQYLIKKLGG